MKPNEKEPDPSTHVVMLSDAWKPVKSVLTKADQAAGCTALLFPAVLGRLDTGKWPDFRFSEDILDGPLFPRKLSGILFASAYTGYAYQQGYTSLPELGFTFAGGYIVGAGYLMNVLGACLIVGYAYEKLPESFRNAAEETVSRTVTSTLAAVHTGAARLDEVKEKGRSVLRKLGKIPLYERKL